MDERRTVSDVIVIGAGPAGLAVGACLRRAGVPFLILEKGDRVGESWRGHYERLHLHTDRAHSGLPFHRIPRRYPRYPSRLQVIEYLEEYAERFELEPRFGEEVVDAGRVDGGWRLRTEGADTETADYECRCLVVATGYNAEPHVPSWPGRERYAGEVIHSSTYRSGMSYRGKRILVVGLGNSGGEIAIDLHEHGAHPWLAVRSPLNVIPREVMGIPILALSIPLVRLPPRLADAISAPLGKLLFGDLTRVGLKRLPYGPFTQIRRNARIPLIDVGTIGLIAKGVIKVVPGIERFTDSGVVFDDGRAVDFDAVVLATGYRPAVRRFLSDAGRRWDEDGAPRRSGDGSEIPNLFFCGFYVSPTGMLREIGFEARRIGKAIRRRLRGSG